jgi:hypothetical protein
MSPQNRRDQLECALYFLRERALKGLAQRQIKKMDEITKKVEQAKMFLLSRKGRDETEETFLALVKTLNY